MADLVVRNLDEQVIKGVKKPAARHNRSTEAEHRAVLEDALLKNRRKPLGEVLGNMPDVGRDEDRLAAGTDRPRH